MQNPLGDRPNEPDRAIAETPASGLSADKPGIRFPARLLGLLLKIRRAVEGTRQSATIAVFSIGKRNRNDRSGPARRPFGRDQTGRVVAFREKRK